jgi:tetratricopeptide (TPR) repeat protein
MPAAGVETKEVQMFTQKILISCLAVLLLCGFLSGCRRQSQDLTFTTRSPEAQRLFLEGLENNDFFYFDEARELFGQATMVDPEFAMAHYFWALTATNANDFQERLARAVELAEGVSEPERLIIMSTQAGNEDNAALARQRLEEMVQLLPQSKRAHTILGTYYYGQQEWGLAEREFRAAIEVAPDFAPAYNMLAYTLSNSERYPEAIEALRKYSELRPQDPNPHDSMGEIYLWMGDHENSIKEYSRSLELDPNFVVSRAGIGHNYVFMGEFDKAKASYDGIFEYAETVADTNTGFFWKAVSYVHEGKHDKALETLRQQHDFAEAHGNAYLQATILNQTAIVYREKGDFRRALRAVKEVREIAARPDIEAGAREGYVRGCAFTEAIVSARQGRKETADSKIEEFRASAEASGNLVVIMAVHSLKGILAYWNKDYQTAIEELKQGNLQDQYSKYHLGLSYETSGEKERAREIFSEIANYNRNSLLYGFVRSAAMEKL